MAKIIQLKDFTDSEKPSILIRGKAYEINNTKMNFDKMLKNVNENDDFNSFTEKYLIAMLGEKEYKEICKEILYPEYRELYIQVAAVTVGKDPEQIRAEINGIESPKV